jgi:hypothetical protein
MVTPEVEAWSTYGVSDDELVTAVKPVVADAVREVRNTFPDNSVHAWPAGEGSAFVIIEGIDIGSFWTTPTTWLGFIIVYTYPDADCYPHYIDVGLRRADEELLKAPFNPNQQLAGVPALMVSRRSNQRDSSVSTAARKAKSVIAFLRSPS